jgi:hypothetical protein
MLAFYIQMLQYENSFASVWFMLMEMTKTPPAGTPRRLKSL